jgi:hypothetical protein
MFESRTLRIYRLKGEGAAIGWRGLHIEKLHNLHSLPNIIRILNSGRRWAGQGEKRNGCDLLCGLVVRVSGCRPRGPMFDSQRHQFL